MSRRMGRTGIALVALLAVAAVTAAGCVPDVIEPTGEISTETREIGDVSAVELTCAAVLTLVPDSDPGVTIRADKAAMRYLTTTESGGVLTISVEKNGQPIDIAPNVTIEVEVRASSFALIVNSGGGDVRAEKLAPDQLRIRNSGKGTVDIERVEALQVVCELTGDGDVKIGAGRAGAQEVRISGAGSYLAPDLECGVATVEITGSGDAEVWATEGLDASVRGTGTVSYWGDPELTEQTEESGNIESLGEKKSQ